MNYTIAEHINHLKTEDIWNLWQNGLPKDVIIKSITGIQYTIHSINQECINFSALSRNGGEPTDLLQKDFLLLWPLIIKLDKLNTDTIKSISVGSFKREHSPLFALLLGANMIVRQ